MKTSPQAAIIHTLSYFGHFSYAPTLQELHTHIPLLMSQRKLEAYLQHMQNSSIITRISFHNSPSRYTLPQYSITKQSIKKRLFYTKCKEKRAHTYLFLLSKLPFVLLIGLSGSVASYNAQKNDDIDLFIVTQSCKMWSTRAAAVALAYLLGVKRPRLTHFAPDKVCTNLWFEESHLAVPKHKRSEYMAYEVVRMRTLHQAHAMHERYLYENRWVKKFFPNIIISKPRSNNRVAPLIPGTIEQLLKQFQLFIIAKHKTSEYISKHQLWFFPDDYAQKMTDISPPRPK